MDGIVLGSLGKASPESPWGEEGDLRSPGPPALRSHSRNFVVRLRGEIFFTEEASITLSIERDKGSFERRKDRPGDRPEDCPRDNDCDPRQCQTAREAISPVSRAPRRHPKERICPPSCYFPFELSFLPIGRYPRGPFPPELTAPEAAPSE